MTASYPWFYGEQVVSKFTECHTRATEIIQYSYQITPENVVYWFCNNQLAWRKYKKVVVKVSKMLWYTENSGGTYDTKRMLPYLKKWIHKNMQISWEKELTSQKDF